MSKYLSFIDILNHKNIDSMTYVKKEFSKINKIKN